MTYGITYGIMCRNNITLYMHLTSHETQKVTAHIPKELLKNAQEVTGKGITDTIKEGLEKLALARVYEKLLSLRGKYKISLDLEDSRRDKNYDGN